MAKAWRLQTVVDLPGLQHTTSVQNAGFCFCARIKPKCAATGNYAFSRMFWLKYCPGFIGWCFCDKYPKRRSLAASGAPGRW
jgi:hypothetical protein